ncbi:protein kinase domain-containing protein, partial [Limnofasciculus baicalensis]|nr:serine/threonine protein kinase [Limnofasciculus baicalensis BBK-W-15]
FSDRGEDRLVLIDFGTAREVTRTYLAKLSAGHRITAIVSTGYTAPEQATGDATARSDFFSLGRTFVYLLTGQHPDTMYSNRTDDLNWRDYTSGISPQFLDLIDWLMERDFRQRPANAREILDRIAVIEGQTIGASTTTVNFGGSTTTQLPEATLPSQDEGRQRWLLLAFLIFLLVTWGLITLTALGFSYSERSWLAPNAQAPQKKGDVDYFPYVEGKDSQGKTAEFNIAVLSREYKWQLGSSSQVNYGGKLIPVESLQSNLTEEGIQKIMNNPSEIISVGTASCEGSPATEEARAFGRSEQIQLLGKKLFRDVGSVKNYRLLNLGQFRGKNCQTNQDETAYQRSIILIGVGKKTDGVILDEALRSRLEAKPFGDFQIQDYSLGSKEKFKTIPSRLNE